MQLNFLTKKIEARIKAARWYNLISVKDYTSQFKWNFLLKISVIQPSIFIEILNVLWTELTGRGYKFLALSMFFNFFYNLSYLAVLIFFLWECFIFNIPYYYIYIYKRWYNLVSCFVPKVACWIAQLYIFERVAL